MHPASVLALAAAFAAATPGAAGAGDDRPVRSLLESRQHKVVLQEWDTSCGAAALATLLRFQLGDPVTERTVALGILRGTDPDRVRGRGGFSLLDLKRFAESRGFAADGYAGLSTGQLLRLAPAIVPIESLAGDHFVVFRGVVRGQAVLADPAFGNRTLPFAAFESLWKARLGFVVKPKARGKDANRLFATRRDLLRVEDDAARVTMDEPLPKALTDAQLARTFASDTATNSSPSTLAASPPQAVNASQRAPIPDSPGSPAAGASPSAAPVASVASSPTIASATSPQITSPISAPTITGSIATPTIASPISVPTIPAPSVTLPSTGIGVTLPLLRPGH